MNTIYPRERLIFPLDLPTLNEALRFVDLLKGSVGVFKVGLELFVAEGPRVVSSIKEKAPSNKIFLDLKFHDIPETVKRAVRSAASLGVDFITVHASEGRGLLEASVAGAEGKTKVLAITVLTSLSKEDFFDMGIDARFKTPLDLVLHRARLARMAGCGGVVCSGIEAKAVREEFGKDFLIVTPGIRGKGEEAGDQRRVVTAYDAVFNGADYIVVGRPIRNAKDPVRAAALIAEEVERAVKDRV